MRTRSRRRCQRYESVMRPYIDRCQDLPNGIDGYLPKSASDIAVTAQVMKWMQRWPFRSVRREKVVHHRRRDRPTGILIVRRHLTQHDSSHGARRLLRGTELGLGDAVDTIERGLVHTDVFADHFWRDAGVA